MNSSVSPCDPAPGLQWLDEMLRRAGVVKWGVSAADNVDDNVRQNYLDFLAGGFHGPMAYLERNLEARFTTDLILPGAQSIISVAFAYPEAPDPLSRQHPRWAAYALGDDYHEVVRARLIPVVEEINRRFEARSRVCVDSAPVMERYRAVKAGVGIRGRNGMIIVPGVGSRVFLAEIFTTAVLPPSLPSPGEIACDDCGQCIKTCPTGALNGDGTLDARKCLSCLTIEWRDELPDGLPLGDRVYGCDECRRVCPHESGTRDCSLPEFQPRESIRRASLDDLAQLTPEEFSSMFRRSAVKRIKLTGLLRNVKYLLNIRDSE